MDTYLLGALDDLEARIRHLKGQVRPAPGRSNATLVRTCRDRLDRAAETARWLREGSEWRKAENAPVRFREFRALVGDLDELENVAVQVLVRWNDQDARANELVERIAQEIEYPLAAPVVACQSREYYRIFPDLGLMLIPPAEGAFLLHLPDLYHELGHPLLTEFNDPKIEPLQKAFVALWMEAQSRIEEERDREEMRRLSPQAFRYYLDGWERSWRSWLTEFVCDVFATHTVGAAYAWAHLHLTAKRGSDPFHVPLGGTSSHPADAARMETILEVLRSSGWTAEARAIAAEWTSMLRVGGYATTPEYNRCFPRTLINSIAASASRAISQIGCPAADRAFLKPVANTLNAAWNEFWGDPKQYTTWQTQNVGSLGLIGV